VVIDHNGRVHMETGAQGTCMTVFLPVAEGQQK